MLLLYFTFFVGHTQSTATFNGTLMISSAAFGDSGTYRCLATSSGKLQLSSAAIVTVIGKCFFFH